MQAYIMYHLDKCYLTFGNDAEEAAKGIPEAPDQISVSQSVNCAVGTAHEIDTSFGGVTLKEIFNAI